MPFCHLLFCMTFLLMVTHQQESEIMLRAIQGEFRFR